MQINEHEIYILARTNLAIIMLVAKISTHY